MSAPDTFGWLQVLHEVNLFYDQEAFRPTQASYRLQGGIPHWCEWGKAPWQIPVTPVPAAVRSYFANRCPKPRKLDPVTSIDADPLPVEAEEPCPSENSLLSQACSGEVCKMDISAWTFSAMELYYLAGLLKLRGFTGLKETYAGFVDNDLRVYLQLARQTLFQRGCLARTGEGEQPEPTLSSLLHSTATAPQVIVAVQNNSFFLVYLTPESIVLQQPIPENQARFYLLDSLPAIHSRLQSLLQLCQGPAAPGIEITIAQPVLEEAYAMLANDSKPDGIARCAASLVQIGLPPESAAAFTLAVAKPVSTGYLTLLHRDDLLGERQAGFAWLAGESGAWIAGLPHSKLPSALTWQPASRQKVELAVKELFAHIMFPPS